MLLFCLTLTTDNGLTSPTVLRGAHQAAGWHDGPITVVARDLAGHGGRDVPLGLLRRTMLWGDALCCSVPNTAVDHKGADITEIADG
jgi:hypothetical protein